jgi:riboflavin kinase/FMN adenylyltransferase
MRLIEDLSDFPSNIRTVVTSGTFDGVHQGHQKILRQVADMAETEGLKSVVLTYWPHPRFVLHQDDQSLKLLTTFDEKAELIKETGIDYLVRIPFTEEFSQLEPEDFVKKVLINHLNTAKLVIGYDHHFGKDRKGNLAYLSANATEFGFEVMEISRHDIDDVGVSSTKIRTALQEGHVHDANSLLGRSFSLKGQVVEGDHLGRTMGFPTANIWVPEGYKLIPDQGVYATRVIWNGRDLEGMTNIGIRPTVNGSQKRIEVNIFNFEEQLYGEELELFFLKKIREEIKFDGLDRLKQQLTLDKEVIQNIFKNEND